MPNGGGPGQTVDPNLWDKWFQKTGQGGTLPGGDGAYQPGFDPGFEGWDPSAPWGSTFNPAEKWNAPWWQGPTDPYLQAQQQIFGGLGGPAGMQDILGQVRGTEQTPFMERLPWSEGQIGQWLTNKLSGRGAGERAGQYGEIQKGIVNRAATRQYEKLRGQAAGAGGRGSSAAARQLAEGKMALAGERAGVEARTMEYEDALKDLSFRQGMAGLGAYESAARGDWQQALQQAGLMMGTLGPEMQVWQTGMGALSDQQQMELAQQLGMNQQQLQEWMAKWGTQGGRSGSEGWAEIAGMLGPGLFG